MKNISNWSVCDLDGHKLEWLVQYDRNVYILFKNTLIKGTASAHFFRDTDPYGYTVTTETTEDGLVCKIPNLLFKFPGHIRGYICDTNGETVLYNYGFHFDIRPQSRPSDYVEPDNSDYLTLLSILEAVKNYYEACQNYYINIENVYGDLMDMEAIGIATDEEVQEMLDEVFGAEDSDNDPDDPDEDDPGDPGVEEEPDE